MDDPLTNRNDYEGNGWSKYQMLVLAQLQEHKELFKEIVADIAQIKKKDAVDDANFIHWKSNIDKQCREVEEKITSIQVSIGKEHGINDRLDDIEVEHKSNEKADIKIKGFWAAMGGIIIILINIIIKVVEILIP